jgi:hypothetical protein
MSNSLPVFFIDIILNPAPIPFAIHQSDVLEYSKTLVVAAIVIPSSCDISFGPADYTRKSIYFFERFWNTDEGST